jgi:(1->4)-alpha-D-glucan 1-alpha-D-glucosylmutase
VDFAERAALLDALPAEPSEWLANWRDGRIKLWVMARLLDLRRRRPALFSSGDYTPVTVEGPAAEHVVAFSRHGEDGRLLVAVPRLVADGVRDGARLQIEPAFWNETRLAAGMVGLRCAFTGHAPASESPAALFGALPACVLEGD